MKQTRLILVGGFLGAGKTTLLWETAVRLMNKGLRVGLITNDQAPELVDSELLKLVAVVSAVILTDSRMRSRRFVPKPRPT